MGVISINCTNCNLPKINRTAWLGTGDPAVLSRKYCGCL